jgi:hypothetical protein
MAKRAKLQHNLDSELTVSRTTARQTKRILTMVFENKDTLIFWVTRHGSQMKIKLAVVSATTN